MRASTKLLIGCVLGFAVVFVLGALFGNIGS